MSFAAVAGLEASGLHRQLIVGAVGDRVGQGNQLNFTRQQTAGLGVTAIAQKVTLIVIVGETIIAAGNAGRTRFEYIIQPRVIGSLLIGQPRCLYIEFQRANAVAACGVKGKGIRDGIAALRL